VHGAIPRRFGPAGHSGRPIAGPPGLVIFPEGGSPDAVFVLLRGHAKVHSVRAGREIVLDVRGPGELLGLRSLVAGHPRAASVTALDRIEGFTLSTQEARLRWSPDALARMLERRLNSSEARRLEMAAYDATGRLAACLLDLAARYGQPAAGLMRIPPPLSQEELAGLTGSPHKTLTTALAALRAEGAIVTGRRSIAISDRALLEARLK
jgi:CRP/FNR family transcriptional regulator, cyclic AMP receptor protein